MALSMRSIHRLPTWPRPGPLAHPSQLPSLLSKRSSQTFARSGNVHAPIPTPFSPFHDSSPLTNHQSLSPRPSPLKPLSRQSPRLPSHRNHNTNSYHDHHYPSFWARNKAVLVTSGVTGLCFSTYCLQWIAESPTATSNNPLYLFIQRNLINTPENISEGRWWVLISSSIAHGNIIHLLLNTIAMWGFVQSTVNLFGVPLFIGAWLFTAASCSAAENYWHAQKEALRHQYSSRAWQKKGENYTILGIPISRERAVAITSLDRGDALPRFGGSLGASGVICGLTGMFLCVAPQLPVRLFLVLPMRLWLGELIFTVGSGYCMATGYAPYIGHAGHLGWLAGGILYYYALGRPWFRRVGRI